VVGVVNLGVSTVCQSIGPSFGVASNVFFILVKYKDEQTLTGKMLLPVILDARTQ
jgi:hypothetical protein